MGETWKIDPFSHRCEWEKCITIVKSPIQVITPAFLKITQAKDFLREFARKSTIFLNLPRLLTCQTHRIQVDNPLISRRNPMHRCAIIIKTKRRRNLREGETIQKSTKLPVKTRWNGNHAMGVMVENPSCLARSCRFQCDNRVISYTRPDSHSKPVCPKKKPSALAAATAGMEL